MENYLIDAVNEDDEVVGVFPKREIKEGKMSYRLVAIFLYNSIGELFVQKRSFTLKRFPGCLESSAGGHVESGEEYETAARRELKEELGIADVQLIKRGIFKIRYEGVTRMVGFFTAVTDKKPVINNTELESGEFLPITRVLERVQDGNCTPVFRELLGIMYNA